MTLCTSAVSKIKKRYHKRICKTCRRKRQRERYHKHVIFFRDRALFYRRQNIAEYRLRENISGTKRYHLLKHSDEFKAARKRSKHKYDTSERGQQHRRIYQRKICAELYDCYIRKLMCMGNDILTIQDIPQPLVEAQRELLKLKRLAKEKGK
jgi:hypothetical protein